MANILILSSSNLESDPRVLRQIRALKEFHSITTCGISNAGIDGLNEKPLLYRPSKTQSFFTRLSNFAKMITGKTDQLTWNDSVKNQLDDSRYDVIIVNDPREMPLAVELQKGKSKNANIYFDLHEWYCEEKNNSIYNKVYRDLVDKYFHHANITSTVNDEISSFYQKRYDKAPVVIQNTGKYFENPPRDIDTNSIKIVHHGVLNRSRKLELMVSMMNHVEDRFTLDFYLVGTDKKYLSELKSLAKNLNNVRFNKPVAFDQIVPMLYNYDIGLFILDPLVESYKYALPNKLFEFIQARLVVAISPNPSMKSLVEKYDVGIVANDYTSKSMAQKLNNVSLEKLNHYKANADKAAKELNDDHGIETIRKIVTSLISH